MSIEVRFLDYGIGIGIGVCWFGQGVITGQDLLEASQETFKSEEILKQIKYALIDFTSIDKESIQTQNIRAKAGMDKMAAKINPDIVVALIASKNVMFGLSRMWEVFVDQIGWKTKVFRSKTEAELWVKELIPEFCTKDEKNECNTLAL